MARRPAGKLENWRPFYIVVEKILTGGERLHQDWPSHGTTGYEFTNVLNAVFVESANRQRFEYLYAQFVGRQDDFRDLVYEGKNLVLRASMSGEQNVLAHKTPTDFRKAPLVARFHAEQPGRVLAEVTACFAVYRSYVTAEGSLTENDRRQIRRAIDIAKRRNPALANRPSIFSKRCCCWSIPTALMRLRGPNSWPSRCTFSS